MDRKRTNIANAEPEHSPEVKVKAASLRAPPWEPILAVDELDSEAALQCPEEHEMKSDQRDKKRAAT